MKGKIITGILITGLIVFSTGYYMFNKKVIPLNKIKPDYSLTANELFNEFDMDEQAALAKYEDKVIKVSGKVISIKIEEGRSNIVLEADQAMAGGINCSFNNANNFIQKGETAIITGRCQGFLMNVILNNCYAKK